MAAISGKQIGIFSHKGVRWISLGWAAFIVENLVLSHNREEIIEQFGDERYHQVYNACSSAACASIAYGYLRHGRGQGPRLWGAARAAPPGARAAALALQALGLAGLSQLAPRVQLPVVLGGGGGAPAAAGAPGREAPRQQVTVRCPFDFSAEGREGEVRGLRRVTRHGAFWSLGLAGAGAALGTPWAAEAALFAGPLALAAVCGAHIDYRYRRGIGGVLTPEEEAVTSNIPFGAFFTGHQSFSDLWPEIKQSNAMCAVSVAVLLHLRRLR